MKHIKSYKKFNKPTLVLNDAQVHGAGVISGVGMELVLTLGTGLGYALFDGGELAPHIEFSHVTTRKGKTFDSWIKQNKKVNVGFIKIDVQGFEKEVLLGMQKFLKNCNDVYVFIEWDANHTEKAGSSLDELESLLTSNGFEPIEQIHGDKLFYKN